MPNPSRTHLAVAAFLGLSGVAIGALGSHRLAPVLAERGMAHAFETGARYHMLHALAVLAAALAIAVGGAALSGFERRLQAASVCWCAGIVLFSGSLYWFALGGPRPLVYVTPVGGVFLMAGWIFVFAAAFARSGAARRDENP